MKVFMTSFLLLASSLAFAEGRPATKSEVKMACVAVDKKLDVEQADMAVDMKGCLKAKLRAFYDIEGTEIVGEIPFRAPNRPRFGLVCAAVMKDGQVIPASIDCSL